MNPVRLRNSRPQERTGTINRGAHLLIVNRQKANALDLPALRTYVRRLKKVLKLARQEFCVCLVSDREIKRLNTIYLARGRATDVLSFPWRPDANGAGGRKVRGRSKRGKDPAISGREVGNPASKEFEEYLGDVVISVETARRNARREGHSTLNEVRWLILHGVLHLLGFDHERDDGEMTRLELTIRDRLGISGAGTKPATKRQATVLHG